VMDASPSEVVTDSAAGRKNFVRGCVGSGIRFRFMIASAERAGRAGQPRERIAPRRLVA
jgi:hypothetical protein